MENADENTAKPGTDLFGNPVKTTEETIIVSEQKPTPAAEETPILSAGLANDLKNELRAPTKADGGLKNGYQFKNPQMTVEYLGETITSESLTDKIARNLFRKQPHWASENLTRGCYAPEDPYWT
jgi:hypothetical protein